MGLGIPPFKIKIVLESNPLKSTMFVGRLGVQTGRHTGRQADIHHWPAEGEPQKGNAQERVAVPLLRAGEDTCRLTHMQDQPAVTYPAAVETRDASSNPPLTALVVLSPFVFSERDKWGQH